MGLWVSVGVLVIFVGKGKRRGLDELCFGGVQVTLVQVLTTPPNITCSSPPFLTLRFIGNMAYVRIVALVEILRRYVGDCFFGGEVWVHCPDTTFE